MRKQDGNSLTFPLTHATDRAAKYTGVSIALIKKVRRKSKDIDENGTLSPLHTPGKQRPKPTDRNVTIDSLDISVTRWTAQEFYVTQKKVPSCPNLLPII
jgi:hypothetical protein